MRFFKLLSLTSLGAIASADPVLYARQEDESISLSTVPQSVTTSPITYETTLTGEEAPTTSLTVEETTTDFVITRPSESVTIEETTTTTITFSPDTTVTDESTFTYSTTVTSTTIPVSTTLFQITSYSTRVTIESYEKEVDVDGSTVIVTVPGTETDVIVTAEETALTITDTTTSDAVFLGVSASSDGEQTSFDVTVTLTIPLTTTVFTPAESVATINIPGTSTTVALTGVSTVTTETVITIPESVVTYTIDQSTSSSSEEESSVSSEESTTSESESSSSSSSSEETTNTSPTTSAPVPTVYPTYCEVVRGPLTPEEEVQLQVLFSDRAGASAFADYVVSYASQLVAQIADVANIAIGDNDYAFTTAFENVDYPGILGLASATPLYTCFLSSLWAVALSNPEQYAKRAVPSQDEKIKLIVLFEKRENDGMQFDYAELLVDETNDLIAEVQNVSAAAASGDLAAYASLFANVDVPYFLSIATEAPIYTEGLSAALQTALESYSQSVNRPTTTVMTTRTFTTVSTIVTNVVSGTVTVPTTLYSTVVVTSVGPATSGRETYTSHTTETRIDVTSETVSEVVRESTLPNGQVTRVTERVTVGAPGAVGPTAAVPAPGERVTVEVVTGADGRVETRTVTRREGGVAPPVTTARPNVAIYTQVQNGVTYTHTVEIQTKNAAFKKVAAMGAGLLGVAALLF